MPYAEVTALGEVGLVPDLPYADTPPNGWTSGRNVRFHDNQAQSILADQLVTESPSLDEIWALYGATSNTAHFWVHAGTGSGGNGIYAYDGTTFTDITPVGGFTGARDDYILGDLLNQNLVATNGVNLPIYWDLLVGNRFQDLPAWDPNWLCTGLRAFKGFLIAFNLTESGTRYPYRVRWSDQAQPGGLPASWDALDPTVLAGAQDLGDATSFLVGGLPLRDQFMLYSERETTSMQFIKGNEVFRFATVSRQSGLLAPRALATFRAHHLVLTEDDVIVTNGQSVDSVIDAKNRRWLFSRICTSNFRNSFMVVHPTYNEVWVCFPTSGCEYTDTALVWDWRRGTWGVRDLPHGTFHGGVVLDIVGRENLTWTTNPYQWSNWNQTWNERTNDNALSTLVLGAAKIKVFQPAPIYRAEGIEASAGTQSVETRVEKLGMQLAGDRMVTIHEVWPRVTGGDITVRIGSQVEPNGPVSWVAEKPYSPGTTKKVTCRVTSRYPCISFESTDLRGMKLSGYRVKYSERARR